MFENILSYLMDNVLPDLVHHGDLDAGHQCRKHRDHKAKSRIQKNAVHILLRDKRVHLHLKKFGDQHRGSAGRQHQQQYPRHLPPVRMYIAEYAAHLPAVEFTFYLFILVHSISGHGYSSSPVIYWCA